MAANLGSRISSAASAPMRRTSIPARFGSRFTMAFETTAVSLVRRFIHSPEWTAVTEA